MNVIWECDKELMINAYDSVRQCMQSCFSEEKTDCLVIVNFLITWYWKLLLWSHYRIRLWWFLHRCLQEHGGHAWCILFHYYCNIILKDTKYCTSSNSAYRQNSLTGIVKPWVNISSHALHGCLRLRWNTVKRQFEMIKTIHIA